MADAGTTSIFDLPVDPAGGSNIALEITEQQQQQPGPGAGPGVALDQTTINRIVNGLQQASSTGATQLPSRDIPQNTTQITNDAQIQPNYIPPTQNTDYISQTEENDDILNSYNKQANQANSLDAMYDELQAPLLLAVLFFLFQLPFFKKYLFTYLPMFFLKDGNYNIYGFIFMSFLFGLIYYLCNRIMVNFNRF